MLIALAPSVYLVYVLEILKFRRFVRTERPTDDEVARRNSRQASSRPSDPPGNPDRFAFPPSEGGSYAYCDEAHLHAATGRQRRRGQRCALQHARILSLVSRTAGTAREISSVTTVTSHPSLGAVVLPPTDHHHLNQGKIAVYTTEMNRQMLCQRAADLPDQRAEHLRLLRESGHPPSRRKAAPRRGWPPRPARAARRLDGDTARRALA